MYWLLALSLLGTDSADLTRDSGREQQELVVPTISVTNKDIQVIDPQPEGTPQVAEGVKGFPPRLAEGVKGFPPRLAEGVKGFPPRLAEGVKGFPPRLAEGVKGFPPRAA